ncbi:hypothetical protein F5878DRAFT_654712 [Lentinula raphanica]|uniref:Uncharacterized protein n=1 Tax=Lentinula raphanica TaxID=153919 RepID=A0AA38NWX8_9AGAR|nr:hypothetical protein F5878DRAFT_654712 [Lentinula raphanica]
MQLNFLLLIITLEATFFSLKTCCINYTTYDVRRDQDTINPCNHADVMMLSGEDQPGTHSYWYARVLGIYCTTVISSHSQANTAESGPQDFEFLWVCWLGVAPQHRSGSHYPAQVIWACHLMPAFNDGRTGELLKTTQPTYAQKPGETDNWSYFYIGIFINLPGGGHTTNCKFFTRVGNANSDSEHDEELLADNNIFRDTLDKMSDPGEDPSLGDDLDKSESEDNDDSNGSDGEDNGENDGKDDSDGEDEDDGDSDNDDDDDDDGNDWQ